MKPDAVTNLIIATERRLDEITGQLAQTRALLESVQRTLTVVE